MRRGIFGCVSNQASLKSACVAADWTIPASFSYVGERFERTGSSLVPASPRKRTLEVLGAFSRGALLRIIFILSLSCLQCRADDALQRVLLLHSYNYTFPAVAIVSEAARKRLLDRSPTKLEIDADFLDLARRTDEAHAARTASYLRDKYAGVQFDVVVAAGFAAVELLLKYRAEIAPGVPVVFAAGADANLKLKELPSDVTGVISNMDVNRIVDLGQRLQPNARRLVVIAGSGDLDRRSRTNARSALKDRGGALETEFWFDLTYEAVLQRVSRLPSDTIVLLLSFFADSENKPYVSKEVAGAVAKASSAPVYGPFDTFLGTGIVGGYMDTFESLGTALADKALDILSGSAKEKQALQQNAGHAFRVDSQAMARFGLKESDLPPDSIVMFKTRTLWDQHPDLMLAGGAIIGIQTVGLAALLIQRRRRKQAEASLSASEDRMTFAAASANAGLWQFDPATRELWTTEHCRHMFGFASDAAITSETILAAIHPDDRGIAVGMLRRVGSESRTAVADIRIVRPDGEERWIRIRARLPSDEREDTTQISGIFVDITEQKRAEIDAACQRQEVAHLMRVSVLGELSGAIAHEVNQPLTAILSHAQAAQYLLSQSPPNLEEVRDALNDIVVEDNRAGEVIHRLRSLLRKGESRWERLDVNELVHKTVSLLRSEAIGRRIAIEVDVAANLPAAWADGVQIQQVLLNLLMNAMDAMASTPLQERLITIGTRTTPNDTVEIRVRDRGAGIKPAEFDKLFEPFFTTKDRGLGLGLSICSTIVQAHGGMLKLTNSDGGGAIAEFSLSVHRELAAAK